MAEVFHLTFWTKCHPEFSKVSQLLFCLKFSIYIELVMCPVFPILGSKADNFLCLMFDLYCRSLDDLRLLICSIYDF